MSQGPKSCKNGEDCLWKKSGKCKYFHQESGVQKEQEVQVIQVECRNNIGIQKHIVMILELKPVDRNWLSCQD